MNADRWSLIRRLHAEALEFPVAERRAFLERECGGDQILLKEIWELVSKDTEDAFLEAPVVEQVAPGVTLGDFELLEEIGSGGTGIVFRARQKSLEREVALKIMPRHFALNERRVERFVREAKAAAKLEHPGIAPIYEVGCVDDNHFFAMELIVGHDLAREIELQLEGCGLCSSTDSIAQYREAARIVMQTADALAFAHQKGVVHRDVKPNNILLDAECRPRLVDFGLAKDDSLGSITVADKIEGTPHYMSPEQARLVEDKVDARTDIYSLGVVLYELLTRSRPFEGRTSQEVISKIIRRDPKPVRSVVPDVPRDLAVICTKAMEKRPEQRYATASALRDDLKSFLAGEPIRARPPGLVRKASRLVTRHRVAASFVCAVALALVGADVTTRVLIRQSWPSVSIQVAGGPEARVIATPINSFTGLRRGSSIDLGSTPVAATSLTPGCWRFTVVRDSTHFVEIDETLSDLSKELVARIPSSEQGVIETAQFSAKSTESRIFLLHNEADPDTAWRKADIDGFEIALDETTFGQYRAYLRESGRTAPTVWAQVGVDEAPDNLPVVLVSVQEAKAFAEWYGYRLPYASEWELAAMGAEGRRLPWGDSESDEEGRANIHVVETSMGSMQSAWEQFLKHAEPADSREEGRTPEGLGHMLGNVAEITASSIRLQAPVDPDAAPDCWLVLGGYWRAEYLQRVLPAVASIPYYSDISQAKYGFRVAKSLEPRISKR